MKSKTIMVKKTINSLRQKREAHKRSSVINGISIPQGNAVWTDDLERAVFRSHLGF